MTIENKFVDIILLSLHIVVRLSLYCKFSYIIKHGDIIITIKGLNDI